MKVKVNAMLVTKDIRCIGVNDPDLDLFEEQYPLQNGMSYNSYMIFDDQIAVLDTVDRRMIREWLDNLSVALEGRQPDYLIVQHMEPDHSAGIAVFAEAYPEARIVATPMAFTMMGRFFGQSFADRRIAVKEGDSLSLGRHTLTFLAAPMVHWPEVMVTYDSIDKVLFSADGFGKFGTTDTDEPWEAEARRYYIGIVGKYGAQVQALLKKAAALDISAICPLHGPVLRKNLSYYISLYDTWSSYHPESAGVVIAYTSVYGNTQAVAEALAEKLRQRNCEVAVYNLSRCDWSEAVSAAFRYDRLVLAATTYNMGIFPPMEHFLLHLTHRGYRKRTVALIENGTWAPAAAKLMRQLLEKQPDLTFTENTVTLFSSADAGTDSKLDALAEELCR